MNNFHISIKENKYITLEKLLVSSKKTAQKKDNDLIQAKTKKLAKERFEKLCDFMMDYHDQHKKEKGIFSIGKKHLSVPNLVGSIGTPDGISVEILPKIDLAETETEPKTTQKIFNRMLLSYFKKAWKIDDVHTRAYKDMPPLEFLIFVYLEELVRLVQRGLACGYEEQEDNLPVFKGRLDVMKQLRYNFAHKERSYVRYDEFTADRPINRLLKAALRTALQTAKHKENHRKAMQLLPHFDVVRNVQNWRTEEQQINLQRHTNTYYNTPRILALLILKMMHPSGWHSDEKLFSLLFKMHDVFEAYVAETLSSFARKNSYKLKAQERPHYLMKKMENQKEIFNLRPDMVMRPKADGKDVKRDQLRILILDTKWKKISQFDPKYKIKENDLYQLYAYGKRYQQKEKLPVCLVLLYPKNDNFKEKIRLEEPDGNSKLTLYLVPVDLHTVLDEKPLCETKKILKEIIEQESKAAAA